MTKHSGISAEEWQLLAFFETEPTRLDKDVPWPYNQFDYRASAGPFVVFFSVSPAYKEFKLIVEYEGAKLIEIVAHDIKDVLYHEGGPERLEIVGDERHRIELALKPKFSLQQQVDPRVSGSR